jgi:hypothetical protein
MEVNPSWPCGRSPSYWMGKQQQRRTWEENMLENYRRGRATSTRCFNENLGVLENLEFAGSSKHEPGTWLQDKGIGYPAGTRRCIRPDKHAPFRQSECSCPASAATSGPIGGSGQLCSTGINNNFRVAIAGAQPGGFFGPGILETGPSGWRQR